MSKSKGNTVEPWQVLDTYGADAFRWYFFTSKQPWDGYRFSPETIGEGVRLFLKQLWSTYYFYVLYAQASAGELADAATPGRSARAPARTRAAATPTSTAGRCRARPLPPSWWPSAWTPTTPRPPAGRSRASWTSSPTGTCAARAGASGTASRRRSRRCARACVTVAKLLAPFCPFIADEIYDNLDGELASVHLCDFPTAAELAPRDEAARAGDGAGARDGAPRPGRARTGQDQGAPAARRGGGGGRRTRARARSNAWPTWCARSSTCAACASSPRPRSLAATRSRQTTARWVRCSAGRCRSRRTRSQRSTPRAWLRRVRDGGEIGITVGGREHTLSPGRDPDDARARRLQRRARGSARGRAGSGDRRGPAP